MRAIVFTDPAGVLVAATSPLPVTSPEDSGWLTQPWATVIAGTLAVAAALLALLGVFVRRAQTERQWRLTSRRTQFAGIAEQLAHANPAVRNAGVYAMETLATEWLTWSWWTRKRHRRAGRKEAQACVDVLCAYLRLPYTPPPDGVTTTKRILTTTRGGLGRNAGPRVETHHEYRHDDREVRASIVEVIARNLRGTRLSRWNLISRGRSAIDTVNLKGMAYRRAHPAIPRIVAVAQQMRSATVAGGEPMWTYLDFNLTGVDFHDVVNMRSIIVVGSWEMQNATFHQGASFDEATFHQNASFDGATFYQNARFGAATFHQGASFDKATFYQNATFDEATFNQNARFGAATFYHWAEFQGSTFHLGAEFGAATFHLGADFGVATFHEDARFDRATIHRGADFGEATFHEDARFDRATIIQGARFDGEKFVPRSDHDRVVEWDVAVVSGTLFADGARCPWPRDAGHR